MQELMVTDIFNNELNIGDEVINVLIYKNEAAFRKGTIENIVTTGRDANVYIRNAGTNRLTVKKTTSRDKFICNNILKYSWKKIDRERELNLFPELF